MTVTNRTISLISAAIVLTLTFVLVTFYITTPPSDPAELLGIHLPGGASEPRVLVVNQNATGYHAYVRFDIAANEIPDLFADSNFQPPQPADEPLAQLARATIGNRTVADLASQDSPAWWSPSSGKTYLLAQRSRTAPSIPYTGPDGSWYILDTTDPARVIVYVFILET